MRISAYLAAGLAWSALVAPAWSRAPQDAGPAKPAGPDIPALVERLGDLDPAARREARRALRRLNRKPQAALAEAWIAGATGKAGAVPEIREFSAARRRQHEAWDLMVDYFPGLAFSSPHSIKPDVLRGYVKGAPGRDQSDGLPPDVELHLRSASKSVPAALRAAAAVRGPQAVRAIRPWLTKGSAAERLAACDAAIRVGDATLRAQAETLLRQWLDSDVSVGMKLGVAAGLALLGSPDGAPHCAAALHSREEPVRVRAASILARLAPDDIARIVRPWLAGDDPAMAALAAGILVQIGHETEGRAWLDKAQAGKDEAAASAAARVAISLAKGVTNAQQAQLFDQQVAAAVERGVRFLREKQQGDGTWEPLITVVPPRGVTALSMLALVKSGVKPDDPAVLRALSAIRLPGEAAVALDGIPRAYEQYVWSVEIMALAAMGSPDFNDLIRDRAEALLSRRRNGVWDYYQDGDGGTGPRGGDVSMTQMALLGLREAANAGVRLPAGVWRKAGAWLAAVQYKDGGWACEPVWVAQQVGERTHLLHSDTGMTAAAVGSLMVVREQLGSKLRRAEAATIEKAVDRGLKRLGNIFAVRPDSKVAGHQNGYHFYYLYGIERCGALTRRAVFGGRDWYQEGAAYIVSAQRPDGGWGPSSEIRTLPEEHHGKSSALQTSFALLFLRRATRPILTRAAGTPSHTPPKKPSGK